MADISKISPDDGSTILNIKDSNAVHWGDQSKGYVGKNLIKFPYSDGFKKTVRNVTFTVNDNGEVTITGKNDDTGNSGFVLCNEFTLEQLGLEYGVDYTLTGCPQGGVPDVSYTLDFRERTGHNVDNPNAPLHRDLGSGVTFRLHENTTLVHVYIETFRNYDHNEVFRPMLRLASIADNTYEPYLTPNTEIDNKLSYADNAVLGAKNLTRRTIANGTTEKTVVVTVNSDDSVTLNGTATGGTAWIVFSNGETKLKKGTYKISGLPSDGSGSTFGLFIRPHGQSAGTDIFVNDTLFTVNEDTVYDLLTPVRGNYTANNLTIKPMIRLASDTDDTYAPHAMTNRECTELLTPQITDVTSALNSIITGETVENATLMVYGHYIQLSFRLNQVDHNISTSYDLSSILPKPLVEFIAASVSNRSGNGGIAWIYKNTRTLNIRVDSNPSSAIDINICYIA